MSSEEYQLVDSGHRYTEPFDVNTDRWDGRTLDYVPRQQLRISKNLKLHTETATAFDPITFEVIRNALWTINEEHADTIHKASASPIIVFSHDLNSTIQTEIGEPVMFAPYVQYFAGVSDLVVQWTLENRSANPGISDGDVFFQNDPLIGANHQMDVQTFAPVFVDGKLFCWTFNSLHVRDIGGMEPSSQCPTAQEIFAEATPIPPIKIMEQGKLRQDVDDMLRRHSRLPDLMALDYRSQLAGIHAFRVRILELVKRFGPATVKGVMRKLVDDASRTLVGAAAAAARRHLARHQVHRRMLHWRPQGASHIPDHEKNRRPVDLLQRRHRGAIRFRQLQFRRVAWSNRLRDPANVDVGPSFLHGSRAAALRVSSGTGHADLYQSQRRGIYHARPDCDHGARHQDYLQTDLVRSGTQKDDHVGRRRRIELDHDGWHRPIRPAGRHRNSG